MVYHSKLENKHYINISNTPNKKEDKMPDYAKSLSHPIIFHSWIFFADGYEFKLCDFDDSDL